MNPFWLIFDAAYTCCMLIWAHNLIQQHRRRTRTKTTITITKKKREPRATRRAQHKLDLYAAHQIKDHLAQGDSQWIRSLPDEFVTRFLDNL